MKKILIIGLLFLLLVAVLPVASAATYDVTSFDEIYDIANQTSNGSGKNITINLKNDIHINGEYKSAIFESSNVTINGNGYNVTIENISSVNCGRFENVAQVELNFLFGFRYCENVEIKKLNIVDSIISESYSDFALPVGATGSNVVIKGCVFKNLTGIPTTFRAVATFIIADDEKYTVDDCEFVNITNGMNAIYIFGPAGDEIACGNILIKDSRFYDNDFTANAHANLIEVGSSGGLFTDIVFENITLNNNVMGGLIDAGRNIYQNRVGYLNDISVLNSTFEDTRFTFGYLVRGRECRNVTVSNNFISNVTGNLLSVRPGMTKVEISGNTVIFGNTSSIMVSEAEATDVLYRVVFNTFICEGQRKCYLSVPNKGESFNEVIFGNLLVDCQFLDYNFENISKIYLMNLKVDSFESVFGSNQPSLNGGKTKNIQLLNKDSNPALNKISTVDYLTVMGSSPSVDKDQAGKKRLYGSGVDYGAVELHRNPIQNIIDNIIGGSSDSKDDQDGSGIFSKTKPSMIEFLFGDDPFLQRSKSLLHFIYSNYVKLDLPLVSSVFQSLINVLGWEA